MCVTGRKLAFALSADDNFVATSVYLEGFERARRWARDVVPMAVVASAPDLVKVAAILTNP